MATSGSIDLAADRDAIINEALELLGVLGEGESPTAAQLTSCATTLNFMVKAWQADVKNLHVMQKIFVFQDGSSTTYTLDGSTSRATTNLTVTTLTAAGAATDTTITVDSIVGISASDQIGIELDDGTRQWTTVSGAPSGSTVTLAAGLTSAAAAANTVFVYTNNILRPYDVDHAFTRNYSVPSEYVDTPIELINRSDYTNLSYKTTTGRVNQVWVDRQRASVNLHVWPIDEVDNVIVLYVYRKLEDFDAATDDADFPQEWFEALSLNLAHKVAPKFGYPFFDRQDLARRAMEAYEIVAGQEVEQSIRFQPHRRMNERGDW